MNRSTTCAALLATIGIAGQAASDDPVRVMADAPHENMQFGCDVAMDGEFVVVGAFNDIGQGGGGGAGHVLRLQDGVVVDRWHLMPDEPQPGGMCGLSVAIDGGVVVLDASGVDDVAINGGAVYVHRFDPVADDWSLEQVIPAPDGREGDFFGSEVAVHGNVIAVAARGRDTGEWFYNGGAVSIYRHDGTAWMFEATLVPSDADIGEYFGEALAIDDDIVVVGTPQRDTSDEVEGGHNAGGVYVFERRSREGWVETAILETGVLADLFGTSVDVSGDRIAVGAGHPCDAGMGCGLVQVHQRIRGSWTLEAELRPDSPCAFDFFGERIALHGDRLAASARCSRIEDGTSTIHRFEFGAEGWTTLDAVAIPDRPEPVFVGHPVALGDGPLVAGSMHDGAAGTMAGAVFTWSWADACPADLDGDGEVDGRDLSWLLAAWEGDAAEYPGADLNGDGVVDAGDLTPLLVGWGPCPN